jgi:hypothetical protein
MPAYLGARAADKTRHCLGWLARLALALAGS